MLSDGGASHNQLDKSPRSDSTMNSQSPPTDLHPSSNSFDSRESRPTSPHNVSSTNQWKNSNNLLAVPTSRSRKDSIDTADSADISSSADTLNPNGSTEPLGGSFSNGTKYGAGGHPVLSDDEALEPDKGTEKDFQRDNNPFAFTPGHLGKMYNPKSLGAFHAVGGLQGLAKGLQTDLISGLSTEEKTVAGRVTFEEATASASPAKSENTVVEDAEKANIMANPKNGESAISGTYDDRIRIFSNNELPQKKGMSFLQLLWMAYNDKILILLTVAAVIALALGLYQSLGTDEGGVEWVEGVAIIVAIIVVTFVGAANDWQKERQFAKLNAKKENRNVKVVRSGMTQEINVHQVLAGDILLVEPGDILPVDGIFITGHGVKCDESSATGESDLLKKMPADEVYRAMVANENLNKMDPFMLSGGKITDGYGRMLVTATGVHSSMGKTMLALQEDSEATPLQVKLNTLAGYIAKLGSAAAGILFVVLLIKFLAKLPTASMREKTPAQKADEFLNILITAVTIVVVAVPEGLPLAVTLALAYATKRMLKDNNLVRVMRSCETMGNATAVCSDKTGTLTQNVMTVVAGVVGTMNRFSNRAVDNVELEKQSEKTRHDDGEGVGAYEFCQKLAEPVKTLLKDSIAINSTAFEVDDEGKQAFVGSKTETALLDFAREFLAMDHVNIERGNAQTVQMFPFDSSRKCMGIVIKSPNGKGFRLVIKGASEIMLRHCDQIIQDPTQGIGITVLDHERRQTVESLIETYAKKSLRTIGFIYRDFEAWPPRGVKRMEEDRTQAVFEDVCKQMTFLGLVGIQDPLRAGVPEAVQDCVTAGVTVRMVTGDNLTTAKAIATECGIYTDGGKVMEGPMFRKLSNEDQRRIVPNLQVLARSSPEDKRKLVKRLIEMGETVAVTGDGTNDAPALKAADVGFAMNISGTEVAKEASDIVLMDDNFKSIVLALMWGRAVNDAVRKFLQFQVTVNITAVSLAFISAVSSDEEQSVLTAVQLLWINLIMDTMAALALATDPPTRNILNRKPDRKSAGLFSVTMWKMIIGQSIYQLIVTLILYFAGRQIFSYNAQPGPAPPGGGLSLYERQHRGLQTMVFNTFTWMQIFNAINNRRLDNKLNIFEGLSKNMFFIGIFMVMAGGQTLIILFGGWAAFQAHHQNGVQWAVALILGVLSIPIGMIIRFIPDELAAKAVPGFFKRWIEKRRQRTITVSDEENPGFDFTTGANHLRDHLQFIKKYKGGRLNQIRFAVAHPKEYMVSRTPSRSRASSSLPRTPNNELADDDGHSGISGGGPPTPDSRRRSHRSRSRSNSALPAGAAMAGIMAASIAGFSGGDDIDRQGG